MRRSVFYYVYILRSLRDSERHYTGFTEDMTDRLDRHNSGAVPATAPYRPWEFKTVLAFTNRARALDFERYLKSHSGRAFARKRL